ncbi:hypothetical protein ACP275_10G114000 [Erythranthe tilingii]
MEDDFIHVCTIEFQKRGLPHAHILFWLHSDDKPKTLEEIDNIICAEIPDEETDRKIYQLVEKYMIHGPCCQSNLKSPCIKDRVCTKQFPKPFVQRTESDADDYTVYRRMEDGRTVMKKKTTLDNRFVVPYNWVLLSKYRSHINIELYNKNIRNIDGSAKIRNEIKMYYYCRYLSACEEIWRLFNFDIHYRDPSVIMLSFYLPGHQALVFNENKSLQSVLDKPSAKETMFLAWFEANKSYPHARHLRYGDFPQQFGYTCYEDIGKVVDYVYPTFKDACYVLGLLDDDKEYIREVNVWASGDYIRRLFAVMLLSNSLSRPEHVWQSCWSGLAEGIAYKQQQLHNNPDLSISDESLMNYTLTKIHKILQINVKILRNYAPMQFPIEFAVEDTINILVLDELNYDGLKWILFLGGRTTHSRFGLPINVHETSTCSITKQCPEVELMIRAKLIMCNEASMMHMNCFEVLDKTMKSILHVDKPFGGKVVVLGEDFRHILPVVLKASRQDIVHATVNSSSLWHFCRVMKLSKNMRLQSYSSVFNVDEVIEFGNWILKVGNGDVWEQNDGEASLEILGDMLIDDSEDLSRDLLNFVYPDLTILAPTNECVKSVNDHLMSLLPGEEKVYLISDSMCGDEQTTEDNAKIYSTEFLNTIRCSGVPSHVLKSKVGAPVMLIRNIDQAEDCKNIGDIVFIPRMTLIPSNSGLSIQFPRRQFPLIANSFSHVGLYLPRFVFSHGQLYVALSRVKSRGGIKIFIKRYSGELTDVTRNVVYDEVFHRI